jgi:hypothetical protein
MAGQNFATLQPEPAKSHRIGVILQQLPMLYFKTLVAPSARRFSQEAERAHWPIVWVQILLLIAIPGIFGVIRDFDTSLVNRMASHSGVLSDVMATFAFGASIAALIVRIIIVPIFFFITLTIQYLVAKVLGGEGRYVGQGHGMLLYQVPLTILSGLISTIIVYIHSVDLRTVSSLVSLTAFVYGIILNVMMLEGVHQLTRGKSIWIVIIYYIVLALIVIGLVALLAHFLITTLRGIVS